MESAGELREDSSPLHPTVSGLWSQEDFQGEGDEKSIQEVEVVRGLALRWDSLKSSSSQAVCLGGLEPRILQRAGWDHKQKDWWDPIGLFTSHSLGWILP